MKFLVSGLRAGEGYFQALGDGCAGHGTNGHEREAQHVGTEAHLREESFQSRGISLGEERAVEGL